MVVPPPVRTKFRPPTASRDVVGRTKSARPTRRFSADVSPLPTGFSVDPRANLSRSNRHARYISPCQMSTKTRTRRHQFAIVSAWDERVGKRRLRGNMRGLFLSTVIAATLAIGLAAKAETTKVDPYPNTVMREYDPVSIGTDSLLGTLYMSDKFASFSKLKGHMDLQFAGTMPDFGDTQLSNAHVYRITNAESFFRKNKLANGYCGDKVFWLGVRVLPQLPGLLRWPRDSIRVTLITNPDYRKLTPGSVCSGSSYRLNRKPGKRNPI